MLSPLFPLLLILLAIGSLVWYRKTANDIYQALAVSSTIFAIIWGLTLAHWSIHLLSLMILLRCTTPVFNAVRVPTSK
jgi:Flp pilus assembly protein protease CpaA